MEGSPSAKSVHMVALPYPGRGHINPMLNLCDLLLSTSPSLHVTFVVTEEWLAFLAPHHHHPRIALQSLPNVIPSELVRAANFVAFLEAVLSNMESPFEDLLTLLPSPPSAILADTYMPWAFDVGNRHKIPVYSFFPMSPSVFSLLFHYHRLADAAGHDEELLGAHIPGIASLRFADVGPMLNATAVLEIALRCFSCVDKAHALLFNTCYEIEPSVIDALKKHLRLPVYTVGPLIPYLKLHDEVGDECMEWLDSHPRGSVLYVSFGSFQSVSSEQLEELVVGLRQSGVPFLWVARGDTSRVREICGGEGLVVAWCHQLRVLCHPSVGAFLSHCGWNSTLEGLFSGKPLLTFPITWDQHPNSAQIVKEWRVGVKVEGGEGDHVIGRERISELVKGVMGSEGEETRERARAMVDKCSGAVKECGSSALNLHALVDVLHGLSA